MMSWKNSDILMLIGTWRQWRTWTEKYTVCFPSVYAFPTLLSMITTRSGHVGAQDCENGNVVRTFSIKKIGELNQQAALRYPGTADIDAEWTKNFAQRLHASSFEKPEFLATSVFHLGDAQKLLKDASDVLQSEKNIVDMFAGANAVVHVVGDLHGHVHDLVAIIDKLGWPGDGRHYIFDGDFVDRGPWSCEVLFVLFAMKLTWPEHVVLLRGNHEFRRQMERYGCKAEVHAKYGADLWDPFWKSVGWCPLIAVVSTFVRHRDEQVPLWAQGSRSNSRSTGAVRKKVWELPLRTGERRVMVVHGGIFPNVRKYARYLRGVHVPEEHLVGSLQEIFRLIRNWAPCGGLSTNLVVWADPAMDVANFALNPTRGDGMCFLKYGPSAVERFLEENKLHGIIRGHASPASRKKEGTELPDIDNGWAIDMKFANNRFHCTVFSASRYPVYAPADNRAGIASICGGSVINEGGDLLPSFSTIEVPTRPKDPTLFYKG